MRTACRHHGSPGCSGLYDHLDNKEMRRVGSLTSALCAFAFFWSFGRFLSLLLVGVASFCGFCSSSTVWLAGRRGALVLADHLSVIAVHLFPGSTYH
jgi:hypothetical protein